MLEGWAQAMSRWRAPGDLQWPKDPLLIQNEPEKQGARAGRARELLVCGLVTLRTRVMWSLASGKWDCELEEGGQCLPILRGLHLSQGMNFPRCARHWLGGNRLILNLEAAVKEVTMG